MSDDGANFNQNKTSRNILIVSDDTTFVVTLSEALNIRLPQLNIISCTSITAAIGLCRTSNYDVVVSDFKKLKTKGRELLTLLGGKAPQTPLLVICKIQNYDRAVAALGQQAHDIIYQPINWDYLVRSLSSAIATRQINVMKANTHWQQSVLSHQELLKDLKVLLVDDDFDSNQMQKIALLSFGAQVVAVGSVQAALEQLEEFEMDILISDIQMPLEDGYSLVRKLRRRSPSAGGDIKAIAMTAYADEETRPQALRSGFSLLLNKPIEPLELVLAVAVIANRSETS